MERVKIVTVLVLIFHVSSGRIIAQDADETTIHLATPEHVPDATMSDHNIEPSDFKSVVEGSFDHTNNVNPSKTKRVNEFSDDDFPATNEISRHEVSYDQLGADHKYFSFVDDNTRDKNENMNIIQEKTTESSHSHLVNTANKVFKIYKQINNCQDSSNNCSDIEENKNATLGNEVTDIDMYEIREERFVYHELNNPSDYVNLVLEHVAGAVQDTVNIYIELIPMLTGCFGSVAGCHLCVALTAMDGGPRLLPEICLQKCAPGVFSACLSLVATSINRMISFFLIDLTT